MPTVLIMMVVGSALFVAGAGWKLVDSWRDASDQDMLTELEGELQELQLLAVTKTRMLSDIKDLEFDHQTGHVSPEDYADMRRRMEGRAIHVLRRLDQLRGDVDYEALISEGFDERFGVTKRKKKRAAKKKKAAVKTGRSAVKGGFCTGCGTANLDNSKFCSSCGTPLAELVANSASANAAEEAQS